MDMESYLVPGEYGEAELVEKRSRFIGQVWRVTTDTGAYQLDTVTGVVTRVS